jgi:molecular chaperone Hsp33
MHQSEQTVSMVAVAALPGPDGIRVAGGYLVQLLPEATREVIDAMTEHLGNLAPIASLLERADPTSAAGLVASLLHRFDHAELASSALSFGCTCSEGRFALGILSLPDDEVDSMIAGDPLEVRCDACGATYTIQPDQLRELREMRRGGHRA